MRNPIPEEGSTFAIHDAAGRSQPILQIQNENGDPVGEIRLFYTGNTWEVGWIESSFSGGGVITYLAALYWIAKEGHKDKRFKPLAADTSMSTGAARSRVTLQKVFGEYLRIFHDERPIKVWLGGSERRLATDEEKALLVLKKRPPFEFVIV